MMESEKGTYALILKNSENRNVQIGRWQALDIEPGFYIYIGSAFGPGGIKARVSRHFRRSKPMRWHIDFISSITKPVSAWYTCRSKRVEHDWAQTFLKIPDFRPIKGFGCSDCRCFSHLFYSKKQPELKKFEAMLGYLLKEWTVKRRPGNKAG